ncbi:peptidase G2 autoproteolytic cleavage domain-containing protein, partial [Peribacillus butanolivorans]|uniref:peptidase G2 autoproteolytic cleavage domain-containing protein n=1 Tax=Peribacillus butanolivorans TaxID=421767 RepID=UPI003D284FAC
PQGFQGPQGDQGPSNISCIVTNPANGCSVAEGSSTTASGFASHAEGQGSTASGFGSHAEGCQNEASGDCSHAEGFQTNAIGVTAHAEGTFTTASGEGAHAEGFQTTASGDRSHAEGTFTTASGFAAHAEGHNTTASGERSHAEGDSTTASGLRSHAEGQLTIADGVLSHTEGLTTCANGLMGVHVMGTNGGPNPAVDPPFSWYLVNGTFICDTAGVVAKILSNGNACFDGFVTTAGVITAAGACDYAEMFETSDGEPIDVGYFVTLDGEKIRKANASDDYILGITSSNPGILADTEEPACSKYLLDEWNRPIYEEVTIPALKDPEGNIMVDVRTEMRKKLNPAWDPAQPCSSRLERPEWVAVGIVGKLLVRDDGTCQVNAYCKPNDEAVATASSVGYRVMKRTGPNQILVLFNGNKIV